MTDLLRSSIFYACALGGLLGVSAMVRRLPTWIYRTRLRALLAIIGSGVTMAFVASATPPAASVVTSATELDRFAPTYHFREVHETLIEAGPERVFAAIKSVTPDEIALFHTLTWIRRFGRDLPSGVLNAPGRRSILDTAVHGGFLLLGERPNREIVIGAIVIRPSRLTLGAPPTPDAYRSLNAPGVAKATMNFLVEPDGARKSRLVTETRVFATDDDALKQFARYWVAIYPGSALLRVTWLRAIKQRAEAANGS